MATNLRVMSFNLHHGVGSDGRLDLERSASVVEASGAEVVALQEVDRHLGPRSRYADQPEWLSRRLGMHVAYGVNIDLEPPRPGEPRRQYGTALLTRHPVRWWRNTFLPRPLGGERRGMLEALVELDRTAGATAPDTPEGGTTGGTARGTTGGTTVRVIATHLQHDSAAGRAAQVAAIDAVVVDSPEPVVLLGDLNATPHAPELAGLMRTLVDAWRAAGDGAGFTHPTRRPRLRIDYAMASRSVTVEAAMVVRSRASDHLPVVADLVIPTLAGMPFGS